MVYRCRPTPTHRQGSLPRTPHPSHPVPHRSGRELPDPSVVPDGADTPDTHTGVYSPIDPWCRGEYLVDAGTRIFRKTRLGPWPRSWSLKLQVRIKPHVPFLFRLSLPAVKTYLGATLYGRCMDLWASWTPSGERRSGEAGARNGTWPSMGPDRGHTRPSSPRVAGRSNPPLDRSTSRVMMFLSLYQTSSQLSCFCMEWVGVVSPKVGTSSVLNTLLVEWKVPEEEGPSGLDCPLRLFPWHINV